jgi:hypothetical protein
MVWRGMLRRPCVGAVRLDRALRSPLRFLGFGIKGLAWVLLLAWPMAWLESWEGQVGLLPGAPQFVLPQLLPPDCTRLLLNQSGRLEPPQAPADC